MHDSKSVCRNLCSELVYVSCVNRPGRPAMVGNLEEIGERFAEILTERSFPRGTAVRIATKDHALEGFVENSRRDHQLGFFVTVRLAPQSHWTERWFTPKHLLQLWSGSQPKVSTLKTASGY